MAAKKKQTYKVGSIIAIPLPDGKFTYARVFRDFDLAVYDLVSPKLLDASEVIHRPVAFFQICTDAPIKSGAWPVIGELPFDDENTAWGPPKAGGIVPGMPLDPIMLTIEEKGETRNATPDEIRGLDIATICQTAERFVIVLENRLIKGDHHLYKVMP